MQFEFTTAAKIIFGSGKLNSVGEIVAGIGDRALILSGATQDITTRLNAQLDSTGISCYVKLIDGEPTVDAIQDTVDFAHHSAINLVIGIGGGSAIDTAKATAAFLTNPGEVTDYLEIIGNNKPLNNPALPIIAIPTTAGTGSEVTKNAVIGSPVQHIKVSLRSPYLLPKLALVDPELTLSLSAEVTAYTGLDALTQLIEPFTCNNPNPLTDALCVEGIKHVARSLSQVYNDGKDLKAREDMSLASLFSGFALANAKLGAVHGLAGPIGGEILAHHGAICARLLPIVMEANIKALLNRSPDHPVLARYAKVGELLSGDQAATPHTAVQWVHDICQHMKIQPLSTYELAEGDFPMIIEKALTASSMKGNPITLSEDELRTILLSSL